MQYKTLFTIGKELLAESDISRVLCEALDRIVEISRAERGMIVLFSEAGAILFEKARNGDKTDIAWPEFEINHAIIEKVRAEGARTCLRNARNTIQFPARKGSIGARRPKTLTLICLPLTHQGKTFGVVYLENRSASRAFNSGICSFLGSFADFISVAAHHVMELKRLDNRVHTLEAELRARYQFESIVGQHPKMLEILKLVAQIADTDAAVLIRGPSGTGKELIAQALHYNSSRNDKPFVPINCGALPENLLESELFGHERGAFTGAIKDKQGWFERADGGTILLDEVSEMSPSLQAKLLRVLQNGEYSRVGSTTMDCCDVRIVAATNKDLRELVSEGKFREDVYYRLNVIEIVLPPLEERKSDILPLAHHFLNMFGQHYGKEHLHLSLDASACLLAYHFPGNVRELEHFIQRAVVLAEGQSIEPRHFPAPVCPEPLAPPLTANHAAFNVAKKRAVENFEREYIASYLKDAQGNITRAARAAGIDVKNFHVKMKKYGIDPRFFKEASTNGAFANTLVKTS